MTRLLPMFPLQLVVYPGENLNLHIFEPRYKQLIQECEEEGTTFGIPSYIDNNVQDIGTEIELVKIEKKYPNGELDIRTKGVGVFRIHEYFSKAPEKLYAGATVEDIELDYEGNFVLNEKILELVAELFQLLNIQKEIPSNDETFRVFDIAHHIGFNLYQEYELLSLAKESERQEFILTHLNRLIPVVEEMENLRKKVQMNGHFKNIIPPEV